MNVVLTGAAGFIGFHTGLALLKKKNFVYGIDDVNPYYDVSLKRDRLSILRKYTMRSILAELHSFMSNSLTF